MIISKLEIFLKKIFKELNYSFEGIKIIKSNRRDLCDYQCDGAFSLAKTLHKNPMEIANIIVDAIKKHPEYNTYFTNAESAEPGFVNLTITDKLINEILELMFEEEKFGIKKPEKVDTYFLDYGGPNIAKPLHVGHLRSAIVGESLKRIINYMGHTTISDVHLGDYGLQIGQVIYGILKHKPEKITLEFLDEIYPKMNSLCKENESVKDECAKITKELQEGNEEYIKLWKTILEISGNDIKTQYQYLDVSFNIWEGESDAYSYIPKLTNILNDKKMLKNSDGAKIIEVKKESDKKELPPLIYQKSNGAYLYGTTDLATVLKRYELYSPNYMIYITDLRQGLHFEQVFRSAKLADIAPTTTFEFCGFGTINGIDGKPFKTRSGSVPKLSHLFKEIEEAFINTKESNKHMNSDDIRKITGAIIKYADLCNSREKDYIFDINKFIEVVGKTGPYIVYTYLRINKIISENSYNKIFDSTYNSFDRDLRLKLIELELSLNKAFKERMPSYIAEYIYDLATYVNTFYQNNHINSIENVNQKYTWLTILELTSNVIKDMLNILGIEIPSIM